MDARGASHILSCTGELVNNAVYPHHLSAKVSTFIGILAQHSAAHQTLINSYA